jgi:hypothetical protein
MNYLSNLDEKVQQNSFPLVAPEISFVTGVSESL